MNCRQTRDLTSAYLDQELTGRQMLEMHAHLAACEQCAREWQEIREVRRLLRRLAAPPPATDVQRQLVARLDHEARMEACLVPAFFLRWLPPTRRVNAVLLPAPRPRGRRLASALALSSVAILIAAAPFAPSTGDAAGRAALAAASQTAPDDTMAASLVMMPSLRGLNPISLLRPISVTAPPPALSRQYTQSAVLTMDAEPFRDEAVSGYAQGATLADYQAPATGAR